MAYFTLDHWIIPLLAFQGMWPSITATTTIRKPGAAWSRRLQRWTMLGYTWVNYNDLTVLPSPGIMVYFREIIPFYGRKIQVRE